MKIMTNKKLQELCEAVAYLTSNGQKFCVHFGYDNAVEKARQLRVDKYLEIRPRAIKGM